MIVGIRTSSRTTRLIPRNYEFYSRILTSLTLNGLEFVITGKQIQDLTTELPLQVTIVDKICEQ